MKIVGDILNQRVQLDTEALTKAGECIKEKTKLNVGGIQSRMFIILAKKFYN